MSKKSRAPRLKVRQPGKEIEDDSPEYVPVDDITFEDIFGHVDEDDPDLAVLGISKDRIRKINKTMADIRAEYYEKNK